MLRDCEFIHSSLFISTAMATAAKYTSRLRPILSRVLKVGLSVGVSVALVVWLFHKVDMAQVRSIMSHGVDYGYIVIMMVLTVLSHIIRGVRWGIQLRAAGIPRMTWVAESVSIFGAYALDLVFPFVGEAWRCVYVARRQKVELSTVVGTDLGDRASDGVMILLFIILTFIVAHPALMHFIDHYPFGRLLHSWATDVSLWVGIVGLVALLAVADYVWRDTRPVRAVNASIARMWQGFAVLFHMKGIGLYLLLTIGIWTCYYFQAYSCFFAFPFTRELITQPGSWWGFVPGLVVFVFGSCSMIVPSNGGLGPWNIAVMFALSLYGISDTDGAAYSILCWSMQAIALVACGIFAAIYIMFTRARN